MSPEETTKAYTKRIRRVSRIGRCYTMLQEQMGTYSNGDDHPKAVQDEILHLQMRLRNSVLLVHQESSRSDLEHAERELRELGKRVLALIQDEIDRTTKHYD